MDKKTQDLSWACLSKEARDEIRKQYRIVSKNPRLDRSDSVYLTALENIFNRYNLTSDTEPEEMLMVERNTIIERYHALKNPHPADASYNQSIRNANILLLQTLFGDKCLPDKEPLVQCEPFNIGDKVRVIDIEEYAGEVTEIIAVDKSDPIAPYKLDLLDDEGGGIWCDGNAIEPYIEHETKEDTPRPHKYSVGQKVLNHYCKSEILTIGSLEGHADKKNPRYRVLGYPHLWNECELDPYTEHESRNLSQEIANCDKSPNVSADETKNETKDNTEEKELNLAELLKDAIGEEIYSPTFGVVKVSMANCNCIGVDPWNHNSKSFKTDGRYVDKADAVISLFPSKVLYEKYPLDAKKAWREWAESRKPKRWRAKDGGTYWLIPTDGSPIVSNTEHFTEYQNKLYNFGNYFRTKEEAQQAAEAVRERLEKFHEDHQ